jgi:hypothetical protein
MINEKVTPKLAKTLLENNRELNQIRTCHFDMWNNEISNNQTIFKTLLALNKLYLITDNYCLQGFLPSKQGRILMFDFNDRKEKLTELKIDRPISNFHPHGISVWQEPKSGITKCMCSIHYLCSVSMATNHFIHLDWLLL